MTTTIYPARRIVTMARATPDATAVAVRDGRILAVGSLEECQSWGAAVVDDRYADSVLIPGFVEAHGHTFDAVVATLPYIGYYDWPLDDGTIARGCTSYAAVLDRLRTADRELEPGQLLVAVGFDPIFFPNEPRLSRHLLDQVSSSRPIFIAHASGHLATVNTALLDAEGITETTPTPGIHLGPDGTPSGELQEAPAMSLAREAFGMRMKMATDIGALRTHAGMARNAGVTTATELAGLALLVPSLAERWREVVEEDAFPLRMVLYNLAAMPGSSADYEAVAANVEALRAANTAKFRCNGVKIIGDGSIQGWTAMVPWPGYFTGTDHGSLQTSPEEMVQMLAAFHRRQIQVHCHCNGAETVEAFVDAVEAALVDYAWLDHRHVVQHAQTVSGAQLRRMGRLGVGANFFINHIWYWGDQHVELTMGPERARAMWPCRSACEAGVAISFHTDSGVTPIGHLHTMWCAVNRLTPSGRVLGPAEALTPAEALHAATLGAAYQLRMDHEIGSIEAGKLADFAVLDRSPLEVAPMELRELEVRGTMVGGIAHDAVRP